jgi:NlpC/P60 family putative phage cell wall peptidase
MDNTQQRQDIIDEAMTWLRTPYRHAQTVKGAGVDCAMLLREVLVHCGHVPDSFDPRPYAAEWYLHRSEERYLMGMEKYAHRIETKKVKAADIALFRFGRTASHGAIVIDDNLMIHANRLARQVELVERRAFEDKLDSYWSVFV